MRTTTTTSLIAAGLMIAGLAPGAASAASTTGADVYSNYCQNCHGTPRSPWGWSSTTIRSAINRNRGGMGSLSFLSDTQLNEIAAYLADPNGTATTNTATNTPPSTTPTTTPSSTSPAAEADRVFDWAEATYPFMFTASSGSQSLAGYYFRHYPAQNLYLAVLDGRLYFYDDDRPGDGLLDLGSLAEWTARADGSAVPATTDGAGSDGSDGGRDDYGAQGGSDDGSDDTQSGYDSDPYGYGSDPYGYGDDPYGYDQGGAGDDDRYEQDDDRDEHDGDDDRYEHDDDRDEHDGDDDRHEHDD